MAHRKPAVAYSLSGEDVAWLAGLLEGEGYVGQQGGWGRLSLAMTDRDVVERAAKMLNAPVSEKLCRKQFGKKKMWVTEVNGERLRQTLERILPFMGARRARRIIEVLALPRWGFPDTLSDSAGRARVARSLRLQAARSG